MTQRKNKGQYEECLSCGASLDHGEECDCQAEQQAEEKNENNK